LPPPKDSPSEFPATPLAPGIPAANMSAVAGQQPRLSLVMNSPSKLKDYGFAAADLLHCWFAPAREA
jgi:hypothetical protein